MALHWMLILFLFSSFTSGTNMFQNDWQVPSRRGQPCPLASLQLLVLKVLIEIISHSCTYTIPFSFGANDAEVNVA